jgi:hypothetical protein
MHASRLENHEIEMLKGDAERRKLENDRKKGQFAQREVFLNGLYVEHKKLSPQEGYRSR